MSYESALGMGLVRLRDERVVCSHGDTAVCFKSGPPTCDRSEAEAIAAGGGIVVDGPGRDCMVGATCRGTAACVPTSWYESYTSGSRTPAAAPPASETPPAAKTAREGWESLFTWGRSTTTEKIVEAVDSVVSNVRRTASNVVAAVTGQPAAAVEEATRIVDVTDVPVVGWFQRNRVPLMIGSGVIGLGLLGVLVFRSSKKRRRAPAAANPRRWTLWGRYRGGKAERIDSFSSEYEAHRMLVEYRIAYGLDWDIWIGKRSGK